MKILRFDILTLSDASLNEVYVVFCNNIDNTPIEPDDNVGLFLKKLAFP
jgi:hypothetical protein